MAFNMASAWNDMQKPCRLDTAESVKKPAEAASQLFEALRSPRHAGDALAELAVAAEQDGDRKTAGLLARRATAINPQDPRFRALARAFADA